MPEYQYRLVFFLLIIASFPTLVWVMMRNGKKFGLNCPSCGAPLWGKRSGVVIASGNCVRCGERVLTEK